MKYATLAAAVILVCSASVALADPESEISAYRMSRGLSAVTVDPALNALAAKQANAMAARGVMDHSVYAPFTQRISAYNTTAAAENIAYGTKSFSSTLTMWKLSWGHNSNLLLSEARRIGVASASGHGQTYWALILAAPHDSKQHKEHRKGFVEVAAEGPSAAAAPKEASARAEKPRSKAGCSRSDGMWQKLVCWINGS
jgi:Cysteine-rich secretory protein family